MDRNPFRWLTVLVLSWSVQTFAQAWQWQNPLPFGDPITQVFFVDEQHGWMNPKNKTLLRSADGGRNWEILRVELFFDAIHFVDPLEGWGIGRAEFIPETRNSIYHTTNGGESWEIQLADTVQFDIFFLNGRQGWATGFNTILHTNDGGRTWVRQADDAFRISGDSILGVTFLDALKGWAVGGLLFGLHTTDGGQTWERDSTLYSRQKVIYTDSLHLWALSRGRLVSRTIDGGQTWAEFTITDTTLEVRNQDIVALDSNRVFVATDIGVFASADGGQSWAPISDQAMNSFVFLDSLEVWGGGIDNLFPGLLHSIDGGRSWENLIQSDVPHGFETFVAVDFVDAQTGWIIGNIAPRGSGNFILKTTDGGESWIEQESNLNQVGLTNLTFVDQQYGWIVGGRTVFHTTNGGQLWIPYSTGSPFSLQALEFLDRQKGWVVGGGFAANSVQGIILYTKDGGNSWIDQTPEDIPSLLDVCFVDSLSGWVVGGGASELHSGIILHTRDGGKTWSTQRTSERSGWGGVTFVDTSRGWAIGFDPATEAQIIHTGDGGTTWVAQGKGSVEGTLEDIRFVDAQNGWVVGSFGKIFNTTDGGQTWLRQPSYTGKWLKGLDFVDRFTGWAVGWQGAILHTKTGGVTSVLETPIEPSFPRDFILYANYPNPFNPHTQIRFDILKARARVQLTIFDILGRQVTTLFKGERLAGTYEVTWDGTDKHGRAVASGVYFYQLQIDNSLKGTKKMLLLR